MRLNSSRMFCSTSVNRSCSCTPRAITRPDTVPCTSLSASSMSGVFERIGAKERVKFVAEPVLGTGRDARNPVQDVLTVIVGIRRDLADAGNVSPSGLLARPFADPEASLGALRLRDRAPSVPILPDLPKLPPGERPVVVTEPGGPRVERVGGRRRVPVDVNAGPEQGDIEIVFREADGPIVTGHRDADDLTQLDAVIEKAPSTVIGCDRVAVRAHKFGRESEYLLGAIGQRQCHDTGFGDRLDQRAGKLIRADAAPAVEQESK